MEIQTIAKFIGALVAIFGIWKVLYEFKTGRKAHLRAEYEFSKKFLNEVATQDIHPYPLEKGYQAIAGTNTVKSNEVEYILSLENPVQCLRDFVLSKELLEEIDTKGNLKLRFKSKYKNKWSRRWRKAMYLTFYFIFALIALSPLLLNGFLTTNLNIVVQLLFSIPFGGLYAWAALNAYSKIQRCEHLLKNQNRHTQRVIT